MASGIGKREQQLRRARAAKKGKIGEDNYLHRSIRKVLPAALSSVTSVSVGRCCDHCVGVMDAYTEGVQIQYQGIRRARI